MDANKVALLVIDVQDSFLQRDYWDETALPPFRQRMLALIAGARAAGIPVLYVLHEDGDGPFAAASGFVRPMAWLPANPDAIFIKHVHNAMLDSGLQPWLAERGIGKLLVSGIRTEQCCETTTRVASDLGFAVDFVSEATLTFAMRHPLSGKLYSADEIREKTELVLAGRFADIVTVEQALARL
ncbi:isochorismatase family protein [Aquitalea sp. USM4]|uniref:isochorismatase family protein n=1 Tax=Aquitalea sp. USM4 TaxID=1590041 RepID=UPI0010409BF7|nr:isochorismatase family protein [Aquitalea sp. USM4]QBJ80114.1 cysteine hydrolase [Aquitalea sp. USM4]